MSKTLSAWREGRVLQKKLGGYKELRTGKKISDKILITFEIN